MISRNNQSRATRLEINQRKVDAGVMSKHYPEVSSIVINMKYKQKGIANPIQRTVNFAPDSYAFFSVDCLSKDCLDGGFDMHSIITSMIKKHSKLSKGELDCKNNDSFPGHSKIVYEVSIQYTA
jgi:hypothetical protein